MSTKRPTKIKTAIAKLRGHDRDRALYSQYLMESRDYSLPASQLLALCVYPLYEELASSKDFERELSMLAMDVEAFVESSTPGAGVHCAGVAIQSFLLTAQRFGLVAYEAKFKKIAFDMVDTIARFGD